MRQPVIAEGSRLGLQLAAGNARRDVVGRDEAALQVAAADAQLHHHRRVRGFRQLEGLADQPHQARQVRPRVEQPQRRLHREGMAALLDHAGAFAVVLAHDDQRAAEHTRRGQVGQRIGRDIGADDRLPRHRAAHRIGHRGGQHRRGGRLVGAGLDMHAEGVEVGPCLNHHVQQVRHRRALVAADVGDARLQQRLGDREDALAMEDLARAELQRFDLAVEGDFQGTGSGGLRQRQGAAI